MHKKTAFVSGSSRGIGKSIAQELAKNDYIVYISGRDIKELKISAKKMQGIIKIINCDLNDDTNVKNSIQEIFKNEGRLDLVVANIGSGKSKTGWNIDIEEYKNIFDINFFSAVSLATHSIDVMKNVSGHIVFISSIAGCESLGAPIAYSSAKTALLGFSKNLSNNVAKLNIRVNSISPGNVMFNGSTWHDKMNNDEKSVLDYIEKNVPLNSFATPQDIAKAVLYLENSNFMTGSNIVIDGGQLNKVI